MRNVISRMRSWFRAGGKKLPRFGGVLGDVRTGDHLLALLRVAVFTGGAVWTLVAPIPLMVRIRCGLLLGVFLGYGALVLWLVRRWPVRSGYVYLGALAADLAFLYFVFHQTGGMLSPFLPAAFLLAALAAVHYGPVIGVLAACASLGLAAVSDPARLGGRHWSEFPLTVIFVSLTAGYVGWLAERGARERRDIERLHEELGARAEDLSVAYEKCREMQDHLLHSERLATIGRMSAEMAHQVRNPLSSISLNLEMLEDEIRGGSALSRSEAHDLIAAIQDEIDNLVQVTESYLGFANLPPFRLEAANLNEIVQGMLVFARPQVEQRSANVTHRLEEGLPSVRVDRRQLKFAIMNVLTNALEAIPDGGRLRVRTESSNGRVDLLIADTGPGIERPDIARIFDPFFTTKQCGTGLGLSLARRIVEAHGGVISCRSVPRVGTTFRISLPRAGCQDGGPSREETDRA